MACLQGKTGQVNGSCQPVLGATNPDGECAAEDASTCGSSGAGCRGDGPGCILHPAGTTCGANSCADNAAVTLTCDGSGSCLPNNQDCGLYTCEAGHCNTSCTDPSDCTIACDLPTSQCVGCGTQLQPPGASCPGTCNGGCDGGVCKIDCAMTDCAGLTLSCPAGMPCLVSCEGEGACDDTVVVCNALYSCSVDCGGGTSATCRGLALDCGAAGVCNLICGTGAQECEGATMTCGANSCTATCADVFDPPTLDCGEACSCEHSTCY
jgi:hypothetical protein